MLRSERSGLRRVRVGHARRGAFLQSLMGQRRLRHLQGLERFAAVVVFGVEELKQGQESFAGGGGVVAGRLAVV